MADHDSTYLETPPFKDYVRMVRDLFEQLETSATLTIAEIHRRLAGEARPRWTMDAIDRLLLEEVAILPGRYRLHSKKRRT